MSKRPLGLAAAKKAAKKSKTTPDSVPVSEPPTADESTGPFPDEAADETLDDWAELSLLLQQLQTLHLSRTSTPLPLARGVLHESDRLSPGTSDGQKRLLFVAQVMALLVFAEVVEVAGEDALESGEERESSKYYELARGVWGEYEASGLCDPEDERLDALLRFQIEFVASKVSTESVRDFTLCMKHLASTEERETPSIAFAQEAEFEKSLVATSILLLQAAVESVDHCESKDDERITLATRVLASAEVAGPDHFKLDYCELGMALAAATCDEATEKRDKAMLREAQAMAEKVVEIGLKPSKQELLDKTSIVEALLICAGVAEELGEDSEKYYAQAEIVKPGYDKDLSEDEDDSGSDEES